MSIGSGTSICRAILVLIALLLCGATTARAEVTVERSDRGAIVNIDGQLFAEYLTHEGHQPAVWPIIGPTGKPMTRQYPMGDLLPDEKNDHLHHVSLWFAHGNVNGLDFWTSRDHAAARKDNQIVHREFVATGASGGQAKIVTRNDWLSEGQRICEDERTLLFGGDAEKRWIDFSIQIMATEGELTLGDTKEGTFGVRVSGPLTVDAKQGAAIINSRGQRDAEAWGMFADWIDDFGPVDGETIGIALFNHPSNCRNPTRWHARTYGLLAANPFGDSEFPPDSTAPKQAAVTVAKGDQLALRYRVLLHRGDPAEADVAKAYQDFAATPTTK
jgi:hypothetical protein